MPTFHPFNPLLALRVSSLALDAKQRLDLIDAFFRAVWVHGLHIAEPSVVEKVVSETGLDGGALIARSQQPECKAQLRNQTDQAIADGVFGVPTMAVGYELFWGYDDMAFLQRFIDGTDPIDRARWDESVLPRSAAVRSRPP
jgi:2-hydroxychromene-2-carboxylate isomerase